MAYNAQGNRKSYVLESWDLPSTSWRQRTQVLTSFDVSGTIPVRDEESTWSNGSNAWVLKNRTSRSLSGGKIASRLSESYDVQNLRWLPVSMETMSYRGTGEISTSLLANWNTATTAFQDVSRSGYTYNSDNQVKQILTLVPSHGKWIVADDAAQTVYYYEGETATPLGIKAEQSPSCMLSPVPASTALNVRIYNAANGEYDVQVSDMSGRMVIMRRMAMRDGTPERLDVESLPAGVYTLSMRTTGQLPIAAIFSVVR